MFSLGRFQRGLIELFVLMPWGELLLSLSRRSSTLTREASSPVWSLPGGWKRRAFESRWIVGEESLITFLLSGSLER